MTEKEITIPTQERLNFERTRRINFYSEMVKKAMNNMEIAAGKKFRWSLSIENILDEMEERLMDEVTILHNDKFELVFVKEENVLELKTTRSNQLIDEDYMRTLLSLSQNKRQLEEALQNLNGL